MKRFGSLCFYFLFYVAIACFANLCAVETSAQAQVRSSTNKKKGSYFSFFGFFDQEPVQKTKKKKSRRKNYYKSKRKRRSRAVAPVISEKIPKLDELPKEENARVLLVVGDDIAAGIAQGLQHNYAETPSIRIVRLVYPNSGLVKRKVPDWPEDVQSLLKSEDVRLVVVAIGTQDNQSMSVGSVALPFKSDDWQKEYRYRIASLVAAVREEQLPLLWVGMAPPEDDFRRQDYQKLNELFREMVEPSGGVFVDIWKVFQDDNGLYLAFGPDVSGKQKRLRTKDGVFFTFSGYRKIAYYVEREIARIFGSSTAFVFEGVKDDPNFIVLTGRLTSPELKLVAGKAISDDNNSPVAVNTNWQLKDVNGRADSINFSE
ncbi:GDSL-type esterase/lipase family protein [Polycladidibacter stylochi]|uniref:SGNH/GDSL hydrolase family protein n=1 Tax=Polycladidibacter stylochi TaxID=1807766 RepID=UPI0008362DF9|nr:GDSL-type esterase/lipase family protein [Pseudovibrio stylochi]